MDATKQAANSSLPMVVGKNKIVVLLGCVAAAAVLLYLWNPWFVRKADAGNALLMTATRDYLRLALFAAVSGAAAFAGIAIVMGYTATPAAKA